jgi:tetratricopeptide (TPR) repeat protein
MSSARILAAALLTIFLLASCARGPSFEQRKEEGIRAFQEGRIPEAVDHLDACSREKPRDFQVRYYLARSLEKGEQFALALSEWEHVLLLSPSFAEGHYRRGNVLAMMKRLGPAIESWGRATELDPTFTEAYLNQGMAYEDLERWDEAMAAYLLAIRADSTFSPAYLNLALLFEKAEAWETALEMFNTAIRIDTTFTGPYLNRIQLLLRLDRKTEATDRIRELLKREGLDAETSDSLSALLRRLES